MKNRITLGFVLGMAMITLFQSSAQAQVLPYLERPMTISFNEERLDVALKKISQQGGFVFSYNSSILEEGKVITFDFTNKTVREILDQIFKGGLQYKVRGKYVILARTQLSAKEPQIFSGYVVDEATGERLKDVTIYDPVTLSSTLTDSYGYFEIKIEKPSADLRLSINKKNYSDTLVVTPAKNGRLLNIPMKVNTERITTFADSVGKKFKRFWNTKVLAHLNNVNDTLFRKMQFSLVPFIGTNHALSGNVINDYSLNLFGGYSLGVRNLEIGGVFNVVRGDVRGAQVAGTFNAVGGNVRGFQMAGIFNANRGFVEGAQVAGIYNFNWNGVKDFSAAGVFNFTRRRSQAFQLAGVGNITIGKQESPHLAGLFNFTTSDAKSQIAGTYNFTAGDMEGWQVAGVLGFTAGEVEGVQTSGVLNFAGKSVQGVQLAGVLNFAGSDVRGAQVAGVLNFSGKKVHGAQLSSVLNYATKVEGVQVGLINIADSVGGVPIGLLSIVLKGYHKIELSADEIFYTNVAVRTGVRQFYNILTVGAKPSTFGDTATHWTFGYGIGTAPRISNKFFLNFDVTSSQVVQRNSIDAINLLNKLYIGFDYQFARKISLTAGATLNAYITDKTYDGYQSIFTNYKPHILYEDDLKNDLNMKMWIGGKIGLRFL